MLTCSHTCTKPCRELKCGSCLIFQNRPAPCRHGDPATSGQRPKSATTIKVYCGEAPWEYRVKCEARCDLRLACGHLCKEEVCSKCQAGYLHRDCAQKCERLLVCGHKCALECAQECTVCTQPCQNRCVHAACGRKCSEPCEDRFLNCVEPCPNQCEHLNCSKRCGEVCDRPPCDRPCQKFIEKCGHACIGMCGEPCPPFCRVCDRAQIEAFIPSKFFASVLSTYFKFL